MTANTTPPIKDTTLIPTIDWRVIFRAGQSR